MESIVENFSERFLYPPAKIDKNPMRGYGQVATEALYYLIDTDKLAPYKARDKLNMTHWWLEDRDNGKIIDPTVAQYDILYINPPYDDGREINWHEPPKKPSKECLDLIHQIQPDSRFWEVEDLNDL